MKTNNVRFFTLALALLFLAWQLHGLKLLIYENAIYNNWRKCKRVHYWYVDSSHTFFLNINFHAFTIVKSWISGQQLCPIATYQPNNLSSLADNFKVFEAFQDEGDVERENRNQINHVHWLSHEPDKVKSQRFCEKKNTGLFTFSCLGRWWVWWQTQRWRKSQRNCPEARWRKPPKGIQPCLTHPIKLPCLKTKQAREDRIQHLWTNS